MHRILAHATTARTLCLGAIGLAAVSVALPVSARPFELIYTGQLNSADQLYLTGQTASNLSGPTPYTLRIRFDDGSPNLVGALPFPGFVAYTPIFARMRIGGQNFDVAGFPDDTAGGITVAIFDKSNIFTPGKYGVGFIVDPVADGAGIVGDFDGATPEFSVGNIVPTVFTGYNGAGVSAGIGCGIGPVCTPAPISLTSSGGQAWSLQLGNRIEFTAAGAPLNTASIAAVPEPATWSLMIAGFGLVGIGLRRRAAAAV